MIRLGVDTGGTFTDFVLLDEHGDLRVHKVLSTPHAPEQAILQGIAELGLEPQQFGLIHGSTVATNAVLEGKGVKTLYVTNRGFGDLLNIGRQQRAALYDLQPPVPPPVVPPGCSIETGGRLAADGSLVEPLSDEALASLLQTVRAQQPEAVAVNLLFSYLDPALEEKIGALLPDDVFVSLSSRVLPEVREYERGMATWLNAWIGPRVAGYLARLGDSLRGCPISVMQSSGDTVASAQAAAQAVRMLLSGPAGGLVAARHAGQAAGVARMLTFDMGGTSTDVALIDGEPRLTSEGRIGRYPVAVPMVDMHTIGAGGGSIAWLDAGGMLQVGPQSAGAAPGPACYQRGGRLPTVTDANLALGQLPVEVALGGNLRLDPDAAIAAISTIAGPTGRGVMQTAQDIVAVANEHMAQALRAISVKRGADPRDHVLVSFGGAGGLHVCALAELLGMTRALVPTHSGVLSALGMLAARPGRQLSRTHIGLLATLAPAELEAGFAALAEQGLQALQAEGYPASLCRCEPTVDVRYAGQSYTLNLAWRGPSATIDDFHRRHRQRYGHSLDLPVELVNLRQAVRGPAADLRLPVAQALADGRPFGECRVHRVAEPVPCYAREHLARGQAISGPAIISEDVATTWVAPGWTVCLGTDGGLQLSRDGAR